MTVATEGKAELPGSEVEPIPTDKATTSDNLEHGETSNTDGTKGVPSSDLVKDENEYPPFRTVVLIMLALYLAMFLVALVSFISQGVLLVPKLNVTRTASSSQQQSPKSLTNFIRSKILDGMEVPTFSLVALRSFFTAGCTCSTTTSSSSSRQCFSSRSGLRSAEPRQPR